METELLIAPDENQIKQIREKFGEDPDKFEHQLSLFKEWLQYQTHLPQDCSTTLLSNFLRVGKLNLDKAKKKFEAYCYLQQTYEIFVKNRQVTLDGELRTLDSIDMIPLPEVTPDGYRITVLRYNNFDKCEVLTWCRYFTMIVDYRLHNETFYVGEILIFDLTTVRSQLYSQLFVPTYLYFLKMCLQTYTTQIKKVLVISSSPLLETGVNMVKRILSDKLKNRIHIINSYADLHKHIPEKYLPSDYDGMQKSLSDLTNGWRELMLKNSDFFKRIDEMKPLGAVPKHVTKYDQILGVEGSFRKLSID